MTISEVAYCLPSQIETLRDLLSLNPDWNEALIEGKTGIRERRIATEGEDAYFLAKAAARALVAPDLATSTEGLILVSQTLPYQIPSGACRLQHDLGLATRILAFDVNHGCSGFVYGLILGCSLARSLSLRRVVVVCSDTYTVHISRRDRTCRPIFSDGASATIIDNIGAGGVLATVFRTDGSGAPNLCLIDTPSDELRGRRRLYMDGPQVLYFTMGAIPEAVRELLLTASLTASEIDLYIFHQASKMVLSNIQSTLGIPEEKMIYCLEKVGNTVSSTIPIAYAQLLKDERIRPNMRIMLMGFGVGYSLAGCIWKT